MPDDDPSLDAALAALARVEPPGLDDDDRWAKRVASRVSTFSPPSRRELDPFLAPPFPDDHQDFDRGLTDADDHGHADHAAAAADYGDARGWEGSMSEDESTSRPPSSLAGLSGLTRSGPAPSATDAMEGAAKGDDSGLIDLRAMNSQPEPEPVAPAAAAAPVSAEKPAAVSLSKTAPEAPSSISASKIAIASTASANAPAAVPPSSTTATSASASAATPRAQQKKGGAGLFIALGGLAAAAAAAAFFVIGPGAKKDEASTASAPAAAQQEEKKKADDDKVAVAEKPAATAPEPQASAAAPVEDPAAAPTVAAKPGAPPTGGAGSKTALTAPDPKAGAAAKPTASAAPTATEAPKSAGTGSLDEVLGIGKDQPTKKAEPTDNLPDKPDSMDVRSAINSKLSAANACVKGLEGPSNASVTFGPSGAVSGVVITSGPAKGTGAESCVKNAFSSAKVPPSKKGASGSATLMP